MVLLLVLGAFTLEVVVLWLGYHLSEDDGPPPDDIDVI